MLQNWRFGSQFQGKGDNLSFEVLLEHLGRQMIKKTNTLLKSEFQNLKHESENKFRGVAKSRKCMHSLSEVM